MINSKSSSKQLISFLSHREVGRCIFPDFQCNVVNQLKRFQLRATQSPFNRRATSLAWHPTQPSVLAVGSKGGDLVLWNYDSKEKPKYTEGVGVGGNIMAMKFHPHDSNKLYMATGEGKACIRDLVNQTDLALLNTFNFDHWFCSLDVQCDGKLVAVGDTKGVVTLMNGKGRRIEDRKLHRNKVTHVEFSKKSPNILVTASNDSMLKLWDIRNITGFDGYLEVFPHEKPINSAYFSLRDGSMLLTTDQHNELRIYKAPLWHLERTIMHPHRQFQHLTPIKANWHPTTDIVVVGRYPDPNFPDYVQDENRTIDFFDAKSGLLLYQLYDPVALGIVTLNQFNHTGEVLASCMGKHILIWNQKINDEKDSFKEGSNKRRTGILRLWKKEKPKSQTKRQSCFLKVMKK